MYEDKIEFGRDRQKDDVLALRLNAIMNDDEPTKCLTDHKTGKKSFIKRGVMIKMDFVLQQLKGKFISKKCKITL